VPPEPTPSVTVIVCTRDRPDQLEPALKSVLASEFRDYELVVVDQSQDAATARVVQRLSAVDRRVRLIRDHGKGLSRARNTGIANSTGELIIFTDDDCQPESDWLSTIVDALRADPGAGIAFGSVIPAPCDPRLGFIVGYAPPRRQRLTSRFAKIRDGGIGANMGLRRRALQTTGGFDEMLGAGGYFPSCEDGDMAYRVLAAGYALLHLPEARVLHYGLRDWKSGVALTRRTYLAVAAAYMKHARLKDLVGLWLILHQMWLALVNLLDALVHLRKPFGFSRLGALFVGSLRSFELGVDPRHAVYRER
jgi:glycosyltransferase involved in cell wall biosynthesis